MKAVVRSGPSAVSVEDVPDPVLSDPTEAVVRVTTSALCGEDVDRLRGREVMGCEVMGHEVMGHEVVGVVEEVGERVRAVRPGDRVVVLGRAPGGQAEYVRVPAADVAVVPDGPPDDRFIYLADLLPAAWAAVRGCALPPGGRLLVVGLGPVGDMAARIATYEGAAPVVGADAVPEHLDRAREAGIVTVDLADLAGQRRPDAVIHAPGAEDLAQTVARAGRGSTVVVAATCGASPADLVRRCAARLLDVLRHDDPLGVDAFAVRRLPLTQAPEAYAQAGDHLRGSGKVLFDPAFAG